MDKYCTHALESLMRGSDWEAKFKEFYFNVCPRFKNFSATSGSIIGSSAAAGSTASSSSSSSASSFASSSVPSTPPYISTIGDGTGFDVLMFEAYRDFIVFFDLNIQIYLDKMGVTLATLETSLANNLAEGDSSALNLYNQLEMYGDFLKFSQIMKVKYDETFPTPFLDDKSLQVAPSTYSHPPNTHNIEDGSVRNVLRNVLKKSRAVRVLWDIENIPIRRDMGGLNTLTQLNRFLKVQGLLGSGIDCRVSAFFAPSGIVPKGDVAELDKGAVELIWVSSKREDADRKLGVRINQEMMVLNPADTTFVIISSDQDFRHYYQLLRGAGYEVIIVHQATGARWVQVLTMHADRAYRWSDIMSGCEDNPTSTTTGEIGGTGGIRDSAVTVPSASMRWMQGTCIRWKGTFGFLNAFPLNAFPTPTPAPPLTPTLTPTSTSILTTILAPTPVLVSIAPPIITHVAVPVRTPSLAPADNSNIVRTDLSVSASVPVPVPGKGVRVYVNYKTLNFSPPIMQLNRGQVVMVLVEMGERGPCATCVEALQVQG